MKRLMIGLAAVLASTPSLAGSFDLTGRWRNTLGREVEFRQDGTIDIAGIGHGTYRSCSKEGDDLCVDYEQFRCRFRTSYDNASGELLIITGRPTENCPDGRFVRVPSNN